MAKRNSTKTATKEALQATEPKLQLYSKWTGVSIQNKPVDWLPETTSHAHQQSDEMLSFNVIQNNLTSNAPNGSMETRPTIRPVCRPPAGKTFNGVSYVFDSQLFLGLKEGWMSQCDLTAWDDGESFSDSSLIDCGPENYEFSDINRIGSQLLAATKEDGILYFDQDSDIATPVLVHAQEIPNPNATNSTLTVDLVGVAQGQVATYTFCIVYTNEVGSTLASNNAAVHPDELVVEVWTDTYELEFTSSKYLKISGTLDTSISSCNPTGVDIYATQDDSLIPQFIGHVELIPGQVSWEYNWLGAMEDVTQWTYASAYVPSENTTKGPLCQYIARHDGRLYFWGSPPNVPNHPYRLQIGGNTGMEKSVARGMGGAFLDIDKGLGVYVTNVLKFKTYNGNTIVTVMCGHENSTMQKRYNLLDENITVSNERQAKGFMWEEVNNVVGCNSRWGSATYYDGLYTLSRYGLAVTTQAMESSNQLRVDYVSDNIAGVFSETYGTAYSTENARMVCINDVIYISLSEGFRNDSGYLDRVVLCYDIGLKSWYTLTLDCCEGPILHLFSLDWGGKCEGLGIITPGAVWVLPTTTPPDTDKPAFDVILESGELSTRQPIQDWSYLAQLKFDFDYIIGDLHVEVYGIDYYGRQFLVEKDISWPTMQRMVQEWMRIDVRCRSYQLRIKGKCRMRLTSIIASVYLQGKKTGLVYGFNDSFGYTGPHGESGTDHHYLADYNNLRDVIVP